MAKESALSTKTVRAVTIERQKIERDVGVAVVGAVIVGSVDGNRIWGKELKSINLTHAEVGLDVSCLLSI